MRIKRLILWSDSSFRSTFSRLLSELLASQGASAHQIKARTFPPNVPGMTNGKSEKSEVQIVLNAIVWHSNFLLDIEYAIVVSCGPSENPQWQLEIRPSTPLKEGPL